MAKRKKTTTDDAEPVKRDEENRVSQVVEVVEDIDTSEALETIKKDAAEIESVAEELEQAPIQEPEEAKVETIDIPKTTESEKQKEVVEELFNNETSQVGSEIASQKSGSSKKLFLWALIVIIIAIVVGGGLIAMTSGASVPFMAQPSPTPTPAPTPTPTPAASLDRKDLTIQVLNGGGVVGAAGKMKAFLEEKGYTVSDTGNTEEYTYEQTEILVKAEKQAYLSLLEEDLGEDYTIGTTAATLDDDSSYDAVITVGKE